jgi:type II secretory pathway component PulM
MPDGDGYLAAAYLVFLALVLIYVAIMATRLGRLERELVELDELAARRETPAPDAERVEVRS